MLIFLAEVIYGDIFVEGFWLSEHYEKHLAEVILVKWTAKEKSLSVGRCYPDNMFFEDRLITSTV